MPESFTAEKTELALQHDRHHQHEDESGEGNDEVDRQTADGQYQAGDESEGQQQRAASRHPVPALGERRVLLELLLDLAEDSLFILGERHLPIIARSGPILNAAWRVLSQNCRPTGAAWSSVEPSAADQRAAHQAPGGPVEAASLGNEVGSGASGENGFDPLRGCGLHPRRGPNENIVVSSGAQTGVHVEFNDPIETLPAPPTESVNQ